MARTSGRGNPPWTRDEVILALDLFVSAGLVALPDTDVRVLQLSQTLRSLPGNEARATNPTFRNPAGVSFKLSNLQSLSTGKGFANGSLIDLAVWRHFEGRRTKLREIANLIVQYAPAAPLSFDAESEDLEFAEGRIITSMHRRMERSRKLRQALLKQRRTKGTLCCDACDTTCTLINENLQDAIFEAHHLIPLGEHRIRTTRLHDVVLLCANCHRIIHRLIANRGKWISLEDLKLAVKTPSSTPF